MRKILAIICVCIPLQSFCQIEKPITKGNVIISGGGTIEYTRYTHNFNFNPGFGYFIKDNLALGLNTTFGIVKSGYKYYSYGIGPYAKYYFNNGVFLKTETFFSSYKIVGNVTDKSTRLTISPGIGYAFFLNSKIALEPSLNYKYSHYKNDLSNPIKDNMLFFELKLNMFL
jgi:hypothetical protein